MYKDYWPCPPAVFLHADCSPSKSFSPLDQQTARPLTNLDDCAKCCGSDAFRVYTSASDERLHGDLGRSWNIRMPSFLSSCVSPFLLWFLVYLPSCGIYERSLPKSTDCVQLTSRGAGHLLLLRPAHSAPTNSGTCSASVSSHVLYTN